MDSLKDDAFLFLQLMLDRREVYRKADRQIAEAVSSVSSEFTHGLHMIDGLLEMGLCRLLDRILGTEGEADDGLLSYFLHEGGALTECRCGIDWPLPDVPSLRAYLAHQCPDVKDVSMTDLTRYLELAERLEHFEDRVAIRSLVERVRELEALEGTETARDKALALRCDGWSDGNEPAELAKRLRWLAAHKRYARLGGHVDIDSTLMDAAYSLETMGAALAQGKPGEADEFSTPTSEQAKV